MNIIAYMNEKRQALSASRKCFNEISSCYCSCRLQTTQREIGFHRINPAWHDMHLFPAVPSSSLPKQRRPRRRTDNYV